MTKNISVPDIGGFKDVEIIEILVKTGDKIKKDDPIVTLESDKSSVEVPSPFEGKISELKVKIGDRVSKGSILATLEDEDVKKEEVISMNRRMQGSDKSLNTPINNVEGEESEDWQDWLVDKNLDQELLLSQKQEMEKRKKLMNSSISILNEREKEILKARRLSEDKVTLDDLSKKYKISRERIRQIESNAFEKLQKAMLNSSKSKNLLPKN